MRWARDGGPHEKNNPVYRWNAAAFMCRLCVFSTARSHTLSPWLLRVRRKACVLSLRPWGGHTKAIVKHLRTGEEIGAIRAWAMEGGTRLSAIPTRLFRLCWAFLDTYKMPQRGIEPLTY